MSFEKQIQEWVTLDNQIKTLNQKLKELRETRTVNEAHILSYAEKNKLNQTTINISDGALKFVSVKQTAPLTLKYVAECLAKCIKNQEQVDYVMTIIKDSREVKIATDIKRTYK
jgi:hypothetical protein